MMYQWLNCREREVKLCSLGSLLDNGGRVVIDWSRVILIEGVSRVILIPTDGVILLRC